MTLTARIWLISAKILSVIEILFRWSFLFKPLASLIRENRLIDKCLEKHQNSLKKSWSRDWKGYSAKRRRFTQAVHHVLQVHKQKVDRSKIKRLWRQVKRQEGVEKVGDFIAQTWIIQREIRHLDGVEKILEEQMGDESDPSQEIYNYLKSRIETAFIWWQLQNPKKADKLDGQFIDYKILERFELHEEDGFVSNFDLLDDQSDKILWSSENSKLKVTIAQAHHLGLQDICALIDAGIDG